MNVVKVDRFLEAIRIVRRDNGVLRVKQVSFSISFEDLPEDPAVPVKVSKLRTLKLIIELLGPSFLQKIQFRPQTTQAGAFRIAFESCLLFSRRGIVLLRRVHFLAVSFVVPPD